MSKKLKKVMVILIILIYCLNIIGCQKEDVSNNLPATYDEKLVKANQEFAFDIFKILQSEEKGKDLFISPLSISTALTMTLKGAMNETLEEMKQALYLNHIEQTEIDEYYKNLLTHLNSYQNNVEFAVKNSVWIKEGEDIKQEFLDEMDLIFNSSVRKLDFSKSSAVEEINSWIADATNEKIKDMLDPPIPPDVIMYLINAIYFNGDWKYEFDEDKTFDTEFHTEDGSITQVEMMNSKMDIDYYKEDLYQAIRLPYKNENLSMLVFLPKKDIKTDDFIKDFNVELFNNTINNFSIEEDLIVQIPKFKIEYGTKLLNNQLKQMGMNIPFSSQADFSRIREGLMISRVLHKSFIEVNEKGSEAAAATIVEIQETIAMEPEVFRADRPFIFMIYDEISKTILFLGKNT